MDLSLVLSLVGLLGGMWIYVFAAIREMSLNAPTDVTLIALGYSHWFLTVYLAMALYLLYERGVSNASSARIGLAQQVLLRTWPLSAAMCAVSFVARAIPGGDTPIKVITGAFTLGITAFAIFQSLRPARPEEATARTDTIWWFWLFVVAAAIPFMLAMSALTADVDIRTDKEFYRRTDDVLISIRPAGYVFRPAIRTLRYGFFQKSLFDEETVLVTASEHRGADLIEVAYSPQVGFDQKAFHRVFMEGKSAAAGSP